MSPWWSRCGASARLMKNWDVALSICPGSRVMAMVPRVFFRPLWASLRIGKRGGLAWRSAEIAAGKDHFARVDVVHERVIVKSIAGVIQKIADRDRRKDSIQADGDGPLAGFQRERPGVFGRFGGAANVDYRHPRPMRPRRSGRMSPNRHRSQRSAGQLTGQVRRSTASNLSFCILH